MAWDFTLSTGGRPDARERRSSSNIDRTTQASTSTRSVREASTVMAEPNVSPLQGLASGMADFFGMMGKIEDREALAEEEGRNNEAIIEAQRRVWLDPEGAKEALRTGDYSKFIDDDELRGRKAVQDGFAKVTGLNTAAEAWEAEGRDFMAGLSADQDPQAALQMWIAEKTEGANPIFANAFMNAAMKLGAPEVTRFQNARYQHMVEQAGESAKNAVRMLLEQQQVNPDENFNPNQLIGAAVRAFSSIPAPGPVKDQMMRQVLAEVTMMQAAKGNRTAYDYMKTQKMNPGDPSSPTIEKYWEGKDQPLWKWQARANQEKREAVSAQTNADIERVTDEFLTGKRSAGETAGALSYWVYDEGVSPQNPRIVKLWDEVKKQLKETAGWDRAAMFVDGTLTPGNLTAEDYKDLPKLFDKINYDATKIAKMYGINPAMAQKRMFDLMAAGIVSDNQKKAMGNSILDPKASDADIESRMNFLLAFGDARGMGSVRGLLPASTADEIVGMMTLYRQSPQQFSQVRARLVQHQADGKSILDASTAIPGTTKTAVEKEIAKNIEGWDKMSWDLRTRILKTGHMMIIGAASLSQGVEATASIYAQGNTRAIRGPQGEVVLEAPVGMGDNYTPEQLEVMNNQLVSKGVTEGTYATGQSTIHGGTILAQANGRLMQFHPGTTRHYPVDGKVSTEYKHWVKEKNPQGKETGALVPPPAPGKGESHIKDLGGNIWAVWEPQHNAWSVVQADYDLTKNAAVAPPDKSSAGKLIHKLVKQRETLQQSLKAAGYKKPQKAARGRPSFENFAVPEHRKLIEQLAAVDQQLDMAVKQSGTNKYLSKMLDDMEKAYGPSERLTELKHRLSNDPKPAVISQEIDDMLKWTIEVAVEDLADRVEKDNSSVSRPDQTFEMLGRKLIVAREGYSSKVYADASTKSVGYGWNINDKDIMAVLEKEGYKKADLLAGKEIPKADGDRILPKIWQVKQQQAVKAVGKEAWKWLSPRQRTGLTSLAYNALSLLGPGLKKAVQDYAYAKKTGNKDALEEAIYRMDYEIRYHSLPHEKMIREGNAYAIDSLNDRRNEEADMVLDNHLYDEKGNFRFPDRYEDWRGDFAELLKKHAAKNKRNGFDPHKVFKPKEDRIPQ